MAVNIYLAEDDENLHLILKSYLEKEGYEVKSFFSGDEAIIHVKDSPDMWVLDIMMPGYDGYEIIREIKKNNPEMPVVFISARDKDIDRVVGLEIGADDYITKPFLPRELILRVKKVLEQKNKSSFEENSLNGIRINNRSREAFQNGEKVELTSKEFDLLLYLFEHEGIALSRESILSGVWGDDYFGSDRVVDDLIRRLRKKLPALNLETIYGYGYRVNKNEE